MRFFSIPNVPTVASLPGTATTGDIVYYNSSLWTWIGGAWVSLNPTASDLLTKIKTVDGTGSGLDAELLSGQDGSYYLSLTNATGTLAATKGGTGLTSTTAGSYLKGAAGNTFVLATPAQVRSDIGAVTFTESSTAPVSPNVGDEWLDSDTGIKYTRLAANGGSWVELDAGISGGGGGGGATTLDGLTDVDTSTVAPTNGQALIWDNTAGLWHPGTIATGPAPTPQNLFVQTTQPVSTDPYMWIQTGLGDGTDFSVWINI